MEKDAEITKIFSKFLFITMEFNRGWSTCDNKNRSLIFIILSTTPSRHLQFCTGQNVKQSCKLMICGVEQTGLTKIQPKDLLPSVQSLKIKVWNLSQCLETYHTRVSRLNWVTPTEIHYIHHIASWAKTRVSFITLHCVTAYLYCGRDWTIVYMDRDKCIAISTHYCDYHYDA